MKDVQKDLLAISATLSSLVKQVEKMVAAVEKESGKAAPGEEGEGCKEDKASGKEGQGAG